MDYTLENFPSYFFDVRIKLSVRIIKSLHHVLLKQFDEQKCKLQHSYEQSMTFTKVIRHPSSWFKIDCADGLKRD